jgi:hypothetical protein
MPIIFQQIEELLDGRKTQTRRIAKMDEQIAVHLKYDPSEKDVITIEQYLDPEQDGIQWVISSLVIDRALAPSGRTKWEVGCGQSIIPKRCKPALWLDPQGCVVEDWQTELVRLDKAGAFKGYYTDGMTTKKLLYAVGYRQPWIQIERIRLEHVQDITDGDAKAEGVRPIDSYRMEYIDGREPLASHTAAYRELWRRINTRKGTRWEDNPLVFVLDFAVRG